MEDEKEFTLTWIKNIDGQIQLIDTEINQIVLSQISISQTTDGMLTIGDNVRNNLDNLIRVQGELGKLKQAVTDKLLEIS
jgi:hypothetical protein